MSASYTITATATGATSSIFLARGTDWVVQVTSATWGTAALELSADGGANFVAAEEPSGAVSFTANRAVTVRGGLYYRLNVSSYSAAITLVAQPVSGG